MKAQVQAGICVRSLAPYSKYIPANQDEWYRQYNITQKIISPERFDIPAQIIIYANKIAITSFGETLMTTIIENGLIKEAFVCIYEALWSSAEEDDIHYRKIVAATHEERSLPLS